jgi:hypothetical protein
MVTNPLAWLWVGAGLVGLLLLGRYPAKATFDNPMSLTVWTVLIAFGCPFWGGPLFLCWVWLLPEKRICPHCDRATQKHESLCRNCGRPVLLTMDEARQVAAQRAPERAELAALGRKYASFEMLSFVPFLLVAAGGAVISYLILAAIATWYHQNLEAGVSATLSGSLLGHGLCLSGLRNAIPSDVAQLLRGIRGLSTPAVVVRHDAHCQSRL